MKDLTLQYTSSDGKTHHEVDLTNKKHIIETKDDSVEELVVKVTKKWGSQQKFVEKLIVDEIQIIEDRIAIQKHTIGECITYNTTSNMESTERGLAMNQEKLHYLEDYVY